MLLPGTWSAMSEGMWEVVIGMWGVPDKVKVPKSVLLLFALLSPAFAIRCYTDLEATQVMICFNLLLMIRCLTVNNTYFHAPFVSAKSLTSPNISWGGIIHRVSFMFQIFQISHLDGFWGKKLCKGDWVFGIVIFRLGRDLSVFSPR